VNLELVLSSCCKVRGHINASWLRVIFFSAYHLLNHLLNTVLGGSASRSDLKFQTCILISVIKTYSSDDSFIIIVLHQTIFTEFLSTCHSIEAL